MTDRTRPETIAPSFDIGKGFLPLLSLLFLEDDAVVNDHIFVRHIKLGDAALYFLAYQLRHFFRVPHAAARSWHECPNANIYTETALNLFGDGTCDGSLLSESSLKTAPILGPDDLHRRETVVTLRVPGADADGNGSATLGFFALAGFSPGCQG